MRATARGGVARGEQGSAMLLVIVLLLALGLLAGLWLAVSSADQYIAAAQRREHRRRYAAEGAMETVLAQLGARNDSVLRADLTGASPAFLSAGEGTFAGSRYTWRAAFLADRADIDGDAGTRTILYNSAFGYEGSPFVSGGYPVVGVFLELSDTAGASTVRADVTPVALTPPAGAAFTAGGDILFERSATISGALHDGEGDPISGAPVPAVIAGGAVYLSAGAFAGGEPDRSVVSGAADAVPGGPEAALGGGDTFSSLAAFSPPPADGSCMDGIYFSPRDFSGPLCGRGVLVVHNPSFDPLRYEASRRFIEQGSWTADYDPAYSHLAAANQPARVELYRGGDFRGLVVADTMAFVYDGTVIVGAVVTLSRSPSAVRAEAPLEILYSRQAVEEASLGPLTHRVGMWIAAGESADGHLR